MRKTLALLVFLILVLAACSPPVGPALQETPTVGLDNVEPTATGIPATPSPIPPTNTPRPTPTPQPTATATPLPEDYGPDNFPSDVNPLTGLVAGDPDLLDRRPVSVKVQTFPRGQRPDSGISLADIVYDYYQNNGLTRLNAIFYGQDAEKVGPIRSGRLLDVALTRIYKSIFAFGGADRRILNRLVNSDFADRLVLEGANNCPPMCREDPNGFNFLMTNTEELTQYATDNGVQNDRQTLDGMSFQYDPPDGGQEGTQAYTRYSISAYNRWDYDPATGRYLRFQDTVEADTAQDEDYAPFTDDLNGEQVSAANVVILFVPHQYFFRSGNSEIIDIQLAATGFAGTGQAYAFRDGQVYEVAWKVEQDKTLYLVNTDGSPFPFKQGNTWFQVVGQTTIVGDQEKDNGIWRFDSRLP